MPDDGSQRDQFSALMARAQEGDEAAYARLLRSVTPLIRAIGRRRGLDPASAEDVVQDSLLTLHRVRHTYDPARPFLPWLMAIVYRRMLDMHRRERRVRAEEVVVPDLLETLPADATNELSDMSDWLRQAIADLPPKQREALELTKLLELSTAEASARSGQSAGAIKVNVHRAIRALQTRLGKT